MTSQVQRKQSDEEIIRIARGAIGDFPWRLTRETFVQAVRAVLHHVACEPTVHGPGPKPEEMPGLIQT